MYYFYREISTEGLEVLGKGKSGVVYRIGDGKAVKIYRTGFGEADVLREFHVAVMMEQGGVPSMHPYEIVRCADAFGIIYEEVQGVSLLSCILRNPGQTDTYAAIYSSALKAIHQVSADCDYGLSVKPAFEEKVRNTTCFSSNERAYLLQVLNRIPERLDLVNTDSMPANLLLRPDGSFVWIDLEDAGTGHPVFALQKIYLLALLEDFPNVPDISGNGARIFSSLWNSLFQHYFKDTPDTQLPGIKRSIRLLTCLSLLYDIQRIPFSPPVRSQTDMLKGMIYQALRAGLDFNW